VQILIATAVVSQLFQRCERPPTAEQANKRLCLSSVADGELIVSKDAPLTVDEQEDPSRPGGVGVSYRSDLDRERGGVIVRYRSVDQSEHAFSPAPKN
jgi:hypothetical protein